MRVVPARWPVITAFSVQMGSSLCDLRVAIKLDSLGEGISADEEMRRWIVSGQLTSSALK